MVINNEGDAAYYLSYLPRLTYTDWNHLGMALFNISDGSRYMMEAYAEYSDQHAKPHEDAKNEVKKNWLGYARNGEGLERKYGLTRIREIFSNNVANDEDFELSPFSSSLPQNSLSGEFFSLLKKPSEIVDRRDSPYLVKDLICGSITILAGSPKDGKSTFIFDLLSRNYEQQQNDETLSFCGLKCNPIKAIYMSEQSETSLLDQLKRMEVNLDSFDFVSRSHITSSFVSLMGQIYKEIEEMGDSFDYNLLVIDTATAWQIGEGKTSDNDLVQQSMTAVKNIADRFGIYILIIHHKARQGNVLGSVNFEASADTILYFNKDGKNGFDNFRNIDIMSRMSNLDTLPVLFMDNKYERRNSANTEDSILEALSDGQKWTKEELASYCAVKSKTISPIITTMVKDQQIKKVGKARDSGYML